MPNVWQTYDGERNAEGERHGHGEAVLHNGDKYNGMYSHGQRQGQVKILLLYILCVCVTSQARSRVRSLRHREPMYSKQEPNMSGSTWKVSNTGEVRYTFGDRIPLT